jgi:hypothetical protein
LASNPILSKAPLIAKPPNWLAEKLDKTPPKLPMGVLTAETMTTSLMLKKLVEAI